MGHTATLTFDGKDLDLPVVESTEGELAVDISQLRAKTGLITLDPSLGNTGSCESAITFIDGDKGILRYRGIPIEELAGQSTFVETAYLLIFGHLPTELELRGFSRHLSRNADLHEAMKHHFDAFPATAPPMAMLSAMINTLSCFHVELLEQDAPEAFEEASARLISKVRTLAAFAYRHSKGLAYIYPDPHLLYCANFLHMMFSTPYEPYVPSPEIEDALNLILVLHADHEQNCSTSTARVVGSSQANLFASCAAAVCALWGPLHGGANLAVIDMLEKIRAGGLTPREAINRAKDKKESFKLMGFGHRVYKNFDPRAKIIKASCDKLLAHLNRKDPLLDIARNLEDLALRDDYFLERKLYPNVDFYSGIMLRAIGIPASMFTVMFAIGRLPGWIAQWKEQHDDHSARICRPRQIYVGAKKTSYVPITQRTSPLPIPAPFAEPVSAER